MKLIKFFFWLCLIFIIAYFLTDLKIGGKTIKQGIDQVIAGTVVGDYKDKMVRWITVHLNPKLGSPAPTGEMVPVKGDPTVEDISNHDEANLIKLIENSK